jgi:hypothetical protein
MPFMLFMVKSIITFTILRQNEAMKTKIRANLC